MLSIYINYPMGRISVHHDPGCNRIRVMAKIDQRVIRINSSNVESELKKLSNKELKFAASRDLNDVWIHINLGEVSLEENLVKRIKEILGHFYNPLARAEIEYHCLDQAHSSKSRSFSSISPLKESRRSVQGIRKMIPNREDKIKAINNTITTRIADINSRYRSGPSLYFYRRVLALRYKFPKISTFLSSKHNLEILYAVLVSWDMNSRGAKMKYFDDFKGSLISCLPKLEAIENKFKIFDIAREDEMLELLKNAYLNLELMETKGRLVSNSKCLHFLFPSLCMPMDRVNTLQYLFNNTNESTKRYLDIIRFQFEVLQQSVQFEKYLDDNWNQSVPKLIDNAIILLRGISVKPKS